MATNKPQTQAPDRLSFSGHETFVFRYGWMKKAFVAVRENPAIFSCDSASVELGVGKNMVRSIRHWALATGVVDEVEGARGTLTPSAFGEMIFGDGGLDPHLEDPGTLWLLHWNMLHGPRCTTWRWAFDKLTSNDFSKDSLVQMLKSELRSIGAKGSTDGALRRDADAFVRSYVPVRVTKATILEDTLDCPLIELQLIEDLGSGHYRFRRGEKPSLPAAVFLYCLCLYWQIRAPEQNTLSLSDIVFGSGSPGSAFKLDELSIIARLESLDRLTGGALSYEEAAGIRQVQRLGMFDFRESLERYYTDVFVGAK